MTSYERILIALSSGLPDRTPVAPEVFGVTARLNGYKIYQYVTDGAVIAESQLRAREQIGYDILFAFADLSVEAEALGCTLRYDEDSYPSVQRHVLRDLKDVKELVNPNPLKDGRMPVVLEACRRLRESVGNECLIAACVMGPMSIASQLMGLENFLYQIADNPEGVSSLLEFTENVAITYGKALIRAGAHSPVVFDPVASPAVIPPSFFIQYEVPRLKRIYESFSLEGSVVSWISIAGPTQKIMPYYLKAGINLATVDYVVSLSTAFEVSGNIALNGNLKPYSFVNCTPEEMKEEVKKCLIAVKGRNNYILGSGCEVPVESPMENIRMLVEAVKEHK